ncbi:MAG: class I SAM-dependent methyltransferase [Burkholderiales bacterium]|nr:class I SAM-dependent methyltransferase [Burkholderiales bacterium]
MITSRTPPHAPATFQTDDRQDYAGTEELWANESQLQNYNRDVVALLSDTHVPGQRVMEFGAGIGSLALLWRSRHQVDPLCVELDPALQAVLRSRGFEAHGSLGAVPPGVDLIYTSNVLEHIDDDLAALKQLRATLSPGGRIAIYVPAMQVLYSDMDRSLGHYRRYGRQELLAKLKAAGFETQRCHYADSLGFFAWGLMKLRGQSSGKQAGGGRLLAVYDRFVYPVSRLLDRIGMRHLMGKNLFALARRAP